MPFTSRNGCAKKRFNSRLYGSDGENKNASCEARRYDLSVGRPWHGMVQGWQKRETAESHLEIILRKVAIRHKCPDGFDG